MRPKRTSETECPEGRTQEDKRLAVGFVGVHAVTIVDAAIPVEVNQDEELKTELRLLELQLLTESLEFPSEFWVPAMNKEMDSMKKFVVYEEVPWTECSETDVQNALETFWVKTWKTSEMVAQGRYQEELDQDSAFASAPSPATLRVLLLI